MGCEFRLDSIAESMGMSLSKPQELVMDRESWCVPSAQRFVWAAKQPLGNAALGAVFA